MLCSLFASRASGLLVHRLKGVRWLHSIRSEVSTVRPGSLAATMMHADTIFAISSGPIVKSGVAVVRLSGPSSYYCLEKLTNKGAGSAPAKVEPKMASLRYLRDPISKEILDQSIVLWFPGPRSFTGEDVVELHLHGSRAVVKGVFEALEQLDDPEAGHAIRPAGPGEFTRRAFENGRMDLTEVEGLSDLLEADTSEQRKQALKQMDGHLRKQYEAWR
jgi:tRNA modification GTPase